MASCKEHIATEQQNPYSRIWFLKSPWFKMKSNVHRAVEEADVDYTVLLTTLWLLIQEMDS